MTTSMDRDFKQMILMADAAKHACEACEAAVWALNCASLSAYEEYTATSRIASAKAMCASYMVLVNQYHHRLSGIIRLNRPAPQSKIRAVLAVLDETLTLSGHALGYHGEKETDDDTVV